MNYRLAILLLGLALFIGAMIPYSYTPNCQTAECTPPRPY
jgi:hypothetical protein